MFFDVQNRATQPVFRSDGDEPLGRFPGALEELIKFARLAEIDVPRVLNLWHDMPRAVIGQRNDAELVVA